MTKQERQYFTQEKSFTINNHSDDYEFCETFLRNVGGEYQFMLKNKNGEPITECLVDFQFQHEYYHTERSVKLISDKDGIIYLGGLKNIKFVS